jgi:hypothetical protein
MNKTPHPKKYLEEYGRRHPGIWRLVDQLRAARGKEIPDWPEWCFLPIAAVFSAVMSNTDLASPYIRDPEQQQEAISDIGVLSALAPWRVTQGIYRFDAAIYQEVIETPVEGSIPHKILQQLPEWCVYIETPGLSVFDVPLYGYFAHLEYDTEEQRTELRFVLVDHDEPLVSGLKGPTPLALHLGEWTLEEAIRRSAVESAKQMEMLGWDAHEVDVTGSEFIEHAISQFQPLVSLLLYLCSANGEIEPIDRKLPFKPKPKKTRKGPRLFPPDGPTTWDVGVRMGAAIRKAKTATEAEDRGGTHASPRPHVRRAHWHTYWTGPRKDPEKRKPILKWLSPVLIGGESKDMPVIIRKVKE